MKSLQRIKETFSSDIRKANNGKGNFPKDLKIAVGELYNSEKATSAEIAKALKILPRHVTSWARRLSRGEYTTLKIERVKGPVRSKKKNEPSRAEKELMVLSLMEGVKQEVEEMAKGPKAKLDDIHTRCSRVENEYHDSLFDEEASWEDIQQVGAGLLYEILRISDFIEDEIPSLDQDENQGGKNVSKR